MIVKHVGLFLVPSCETMIDECTCVYMNDCIGSLEIMFNHILTTCTVQNIERCVYIWNCFVDSMGLSR